MPLVGYACPVGSPTYGERHDVAHCLGECQKPCVSGPLLNAIYRAERENHHVGAYISASMLTGGNCSRQVVYERTYPFYEYPRSRWWAFRGTMNHTLVEQAGVGMEAYGWGQELRMAVPLVYPDLPAPIFDPDTGLFTGQYDDRKPLEFTLGGTTDAHNVLRGALHDYKSMADAKVLMTAQGAKGGTFSPQLDDKWVWQLNIYRWLVAHTRIAPEVRERFNLEGEFYPAPTELVIQGFGMMDLLQTGTSVQVKVPNGKWAKYATFDVDAVPVLPLDEIEAYIRPRALQWYRYLVLGEVPPVVEEADKWLCKGCCFNGDLIEGERCHPTEERGRPKRKSGQVPLTDASYP